MPTRLALTVGDPTGIGPEITAKMLARWEGLNEIELVVLGSRSALDQAARSLGLNLPRTANILYHDILAPSPGAIAYQAVEAGVRLLKEGTAHALVTGPISKRNLKMAGYDYAGHTEILETLARNLWHMPNAQAEMLFAYKDFRLLLLTRHIALNAVPRALSDASAVKASFEILITFLTERLKISQPHLTVLGVNPHAGEVGGTEEKAVLSPLMHELEKTAAARFTGPVAADGFFRGFDPENPRTDAIVAAYHDQGLIPFKILSGYEAVNVTIGLPFMRTSVSHGTAEDIVGRGIAREDSLVAALHMALKVL